MPKIELSDFPQVRIDELLSEETVLGLLSVNTIALNGIACAIDIRDMPMDPLFQLENTIGGRLGCDKDAEGYTKTGIRLGATFKSLYDNYSKRVSAVPQLLIAQFDAEPTQDDASVKARYFMPSLRPGDRSASAISVVYEPKPTNPKGNKTPITSLKKTKSQPIKGATNPFAHEISGSISSFIDRRSGNAIKQQRSSGLGTI